MFFEEITERRRSRRGRQLDAACWLLFLGWLCVVLLFPGLPDGAGAIGVGAIVLAGALARVALRASVSLSWVVIGLMFAVAGGAKYAGFDLPLLPLALIVCGLLLLFHGRGARRG